MPFAPRDPCFLGREFVGVAAGVGCPAAHAGDAALLFRAHGRKSPLGAAVARLIGFVAHVFPLKKDSTTCAVGRLLGKWPNAPTKPPDLTHGSYGRAVRFTGPGSFFQLCSGFHLRLVAVMPAMPVLRLSCTAHPSMPANHSHAAFPAHCAERAERALAVLEAQGDTGAGASRLRHDLRGRLATLRSALDVLEIVPGDSALALEASEIAQRHAAQLEEVLNGIQEGRSGKRTDR